MSLRSKNWPWMGAACAVLLLGCGGGGGGGQALTPTAPTFENVRASATDQEVFEGNDPLQPVVITADVTGDLSLLPGTIYVVVEDPDALFGSNPLLVLSPNGLGNQLTLQPRFGANRAGTYTGPLRVNVCADLACRTPLRGSPFTVPYRFVVLPGLQVTSAGPAQFQTSFGSVPAAWSSGVSLPGGATEFQATLRSFTSSTYPVMALSQSTQAITLTPAISPVANHRFEVTVTATGRTSKGRSVPFAQTLSVAYDVQSVPGMPLIFTPNELHLSIAARGGQTDYQRVETLLAGGEVLEGVYSITALSGAPGLWLQYRTLPMTGYRGAIEFSASACSLSPPPPGVDPCLLPGVYLTKVALRTSGGLITREFDVWLTVTP